MSMEGLVESLRSSLLVKGREDSMVFSLPTPARSRRNALFFEGPLGEMPSMMEDRLAEQM